MFTIAIITALFSTCIRIASAQIGEPKDFLDSCENVTYLDTNDWILSATCSPFMDIAPNTTSFIYLSDVLTNDNGALAVRFPYQISQIMLLIEFAS